MPLDIFGDASQIAVERALNEFRAARPVAVRDGDSLALAFPVEGLVASDIFFLRDKGHGARLVIPGHKAQLAQTEAAALTLEPFTLETVEAVAGHAHDNEMNGKAAYHAETAEAGVVDLAALTLTHLSLLLPAAIVANISKAALKKLPALSVDAADIFAFRDHAARSLHIVTRTFVPLEEAGACEFVVFRGGDGFRDQIAVVVGNPQPDEPVLVRIHSACLTGDLFGSLKCDCGDQLRGTVKAMAEHGGGILLYLDQEGRGNGIANKIRAYGLQAEGLDTFDADERLGFGLDQRRFDFAAEMLKQLGFHSIRLMTNNPLKIAALRDAGLDVVSTQRVRGRTTEHNAKYLAAKRDRAGHLIDAALEGADVESSLEAPAAGS